MDAYTQAIVDRLAAMAREAEDAHTMRCTYGEPMTYLPAHRAYAPGHIYSEMGVNEARISGMCEYHFDFLFEPGWTDPVTGQRGATPAEEGDD